MSPVNVFLIDGTYELFRHFYAVPAAKDADGIEIGAVRGVLGSIVTMLENDVTHLGVATDHVIESFRNELWPGYKTGEGIDPILHAQFHPLEDALTAMGVAVWPMREFEADDGLASATMRAVADERVEQVFICTPDKDLAQCVVGDRVVQFDRRAGVVRNATKVKEKFGVAPESIPDYLALMGDSADGFPGLRGWGAKSAGLVIGRYEHLEAIPEATEGWDVKVRGAAKLAKTLVDHRAEAVKFRELATLRVDAPVFDAVDDLLWAGPRSDFFDRCAKMNASGIYRRVDRLAKQRRA
ncbi:MAG: 5'-3' exonuclease H3TH domain-containing protein [Vicinamibacterales bacterium]|nr:5'-3' exonuclease H3TH domain-containing protein [Vicinamibacterales bacterium]MDP7671841.1 5'-3' exonuclease H3TH domain-containing protein [Vicinamibacterales bacterium]HJO38643.1 5'-3' exonuclease H3TH domain-containing protein [Vicinamibacterales bacterium]